MQLNLISVLVSDESNYITGSEIVVDCGYTSFALSGVLRTLQAEYSTAAPAGARNVRAVASTHRAPAKV
jgi:hypothetical protein